MPSRPFSFITAALTSAALVTTPLASSQALAGGSSHFGGYGGSHGGSNVGCWRGDSGCNGNTSAAERKAEALGTRFFWPDGRDVARGYFRLSDST